MGLGDFGIADAFGGLNSDLFDMFAGGGVREASPSGAFAGADELGPAFQQFLLGRLTGDVTDRREFAIGSQAIRDAISTSSATARQRLGDTAVTGGFLDAGSVRRGLTDIDRAEIGAFADSINKLILGLEQERTAGVLPFLAGASQESTGIQSLNIQGDIAARGQNLGFAQSIMGLFGCWVAREVYGTGDGRWLLARYYVFNMAPGWFRRFYWKHGARIASLVRRLPVLKSVLRPMFDRFVTLAKDDLWHKIRRL
jgi:hypothetical protein